MNIYEIKNNEISLDITDNEFIGLIGTEACGKTSLLRMLGLIEKPDSGQIIFKGKDLSSYSYDDAAKVRRENIGFIYQDFNLINSLSIEENIMMPLLLSKHRKKAMKTRVLQCADHFEISHLLKRMPYDLTNGEKQRVSICRALIHDPDVILADEPTANLDVHSATMVIETLKQIHAEQKKTIIIATQDPFIASYCTRVHLLKDGKITRTINATGDNASFCRKIVNQLIYLQYARNIVDTEDFRLVGTSTNKQKIFYNDILYIEKEKGTKYILYVTEKGNYRELITLDSLMQELKPDSFIFISRSILVNINHIQRLQGNTIHLDNNEVFEISRNKSMEAKEKIHTYWNDI